MSTMQQLGEDAVKPVDEPMTLTRMQDIWARMTPEQRLLCARFYDCLHQGRYSARVIMTDDTLSNPVGEIKQQWDEIKDNTLKFGGSHD